MFVSVTNSLLFWHKSVAETVVDSGSRNCPNEFYEILRNRKKPKDDKRKHGMLLEAFKSLAKLAIDNGDDFGACICKDKADHKEGAGQGCTENWDGSCQSKIGQ